MTKSDTFKIFIIVLKCIFIKYIPAKVKWTIFFKIRTLCIKYTLMIGLFSAQYNVILYVIILYIHINYYYKFGKTDHNIWLVGISSDFGTSQLGYKKHIHNIPPVSNKQAINKYLNDNTTVFANTAASDTTTNTTTTAAATTITAATTSTTTTTTSAIYSSWR